jgi:hypothetical protein
VAFAHRYLGQLIDGKAAPVAARSQPTAALASELEEERLVTPFLCAEHIRAQFAEAAPENGVDWCLSRIACLISG